MCFRETRIEIVELCFFNPGNYKGVNYPLFEFFRSLVLQFCEKQKELILEASICDVLMIESLQLWVNAIQSYGKTTKSSIQNFLDFVMKTYDFFKFTTLFISHFHILLSDSSIYSSLF